MHTTSRFLAAAAALGAVEAYTGFNYGNRFTDERIKTQADYEAEFSTAAGLEGTNGIFTSARLYTMIQGGVPNNAPIEAIPAAINTGTSLLLGLWASAGDVIFNNELDALRQAIEQYGDSDLQIAGISVGSEDLYRISPTGIANDEFAGAQPDKLVDYIAMVRDVISGTAFDGVPVGHVDTWTAFVNGSNSAVIDACDFLGMDAYAYFESTKPNAIANGELLFDEALAATEAMSRGKPVWITETGWPVSGKTVGEGVPSPENARRFWVDVGCKLFGETNVWWYTFQDAAPGTPNPSFGVIGSDLTTTPLYDLSCPAGGDGDDGDDDDDDDDAPTTTAQPTSDSEPTTAQPTTTADGGDDDDGEDDSGDETETDVPAPSTATSTDETMTITRASSSAPTSVPTDEPSETSDDAEEPTTSGPTTVPSGVAGQLDSGLTVAAACVVAALALQ